MGMAKLPITLAQPEPDSRATTPIPRDWLEEFDAAARRPLDTTADYRRWCEQHLPDWLGYGRV